MEYTLTYDDSVKGWRSFYSYVPDWIVGMNNSFFTFKGGNLYSHYTNELRNNFYGVQYSSTIKSVFNDSPTENKLLKTIKIEGYKAWEVSLYTDIQTNGFVDDTWFVKKEGAYFANIRILGEIPADIGEYPLRSLGGIGTSLTISNITGGKQINFANTINIGSIVSVGDYIYFVTAGVPYLAGQVIDINVDLPNSVNNIQINNTITGAVAIPVGDQFFMFIKNQTAESQGLLGHYCVFELTSTLTSKNELFVISSDVMKSYP